MPQVCKEPTPERPQMPLEQLADAASLDDFVRAATAEVDRREAYEIRLLTALENCKRE